MAEHDGLFDDWDLEVPRRWIDYVDWLSPRRWLRRPRTRMVNGYECKFEYDSGCWKFTHRIVAETMIGGPIPPGHEVHHINGNKRDNRPENLAVLAREEHRQLHEKARAAAAAGASYVDALVKAYHDLVNSKSARSEDREPPAPAHPKPNHSGPATQAQRTNPSTTLGATIAQYIAASALQGSTCPRCGGAGVLPQFYHVENGICFRCGGSGVDDGSGEWDDRDDDIDDEMHDNDLDDELDDEDDDPYEDMDDDDDLFDELDEDDDWDDDY